MIIDSFTFFNEYELCDIRLNYLSKTVDAFVIIESNLTWRANPNRKKFDKVFAKLDDSIKKKIHYEFLEYDQELYIHDKQFHTNKKTIQDYSRNKLVFNSREIGGKDTLFFYSDLDEFWDKRCLKEIEKKVETHKFIVCNQDFRIVYVDWFARQREWGGTRVTRLEHIDNDHPLSSGKFHHSKSRIFRRLENIRCGWHLSYFGSIEQRTQKLKNIKDSKDWEERKNKSYDEIAKSISNINEWNAIARKKKMNARYNLPGIPLDPDLEKLFKKYPAFYEKSSKKL